MNQRFVARTAAVALVLLTVGCFPAGPEEEPIRSAPFGPGVETSLPGDRMEIVRPDGEHVLKLRISNHAVRVYDAMGVRLGTASTIGDELKVADRAGEAVCEPGGHENATLTVRCGEDEEIRVNVADVIEVRLPSGETFSLRPQPETEEPAEIQVLRGDSSGWSTAWSGEDIVLKEDDEERLRLRNAHRRSFLEGSLLIVAALDADALIAADRADTLLGTLAAVWMGNKLQSAEGRGDEPVLESETPTGESGAATVNGPAEDRPPNEADGSTNESQPDTTESGDTRAE